MSAITLNAIGCGRVGRTLVRLWSQSGAFAIGDVFDHTRAKSEAAVAFIGGGRAVGGISEMRRAGVWMLAPPDDQIVSCCAALVRGGGVMIMRLRHGPVPPGRRMFEVSAEETISLAEPLGLCCVLHRPAEPSSRQPGVSWTRLAFIKAV